MESPGYSGANNEQQDPERWRKWLRVLVYECARPRMLPGPNVTQMPADHWFQYVRDLQESGEQVASQRAASREYAEFPESFDMDPAECSRIYELDEDIQKQLAMAKQNQSEQLGKLLMELDDARTTD